MKITVLLLALAISWICASPSKAQVPTSYTATDLGSVYSPWVDTRAYDINNAGDITGSLICGNGVPSAFLWHNGTITDLFYTAGYFWWGSFSGNYESGCCINSSGQIAGVGDGHDFLFNTPIARDVVYGHSAYDTYSFFRPGLNDNGTLVSSYHDTTGHPFKYSGTTLTLLTGIDASASLNSVNNLEEITGTSSVSKPYLYSSGTEYILSTLGGDYGEGFDINEGGEITGDSYLSGNITHHAFLFRPAVPNGTAGRIRDLGTLGGTNSHASGINYFGEIVGNSTTSSGATHSFVFIDGVMHDLNSLTTVPGGYVLDGAPSINDKGEIAVSGRLSPSGYSHSFKLTPVF